MDSYIIKKDESPAALAKKYTGDASRYTDLFSVNELTPATDGRTGKPAFMSDEWREGRRINIPASWTRIGGAGRVALTDRRFVPPKPGQMAGPRGNVGALDPANDPGDDNGYGIRDENDTVGSSDGSPCTPGGAEVTQFKPYYYVVQSDDIGNFWKIPGKFNMPTSTEMWHQLRNANLNWAGGFTTVNQACVLAGLTAGAKLRVPANWQEPKSNVTIIYPKDDHTCGDGLVYYGGKCVPKGDVPGIDPVNLTSDDSGSTVLALLAVVGLAAVGGVYLYKQRNKR